MTDMKRITCSFPDDIVSALDAEKQKGRLSGRPYSALIRHFVALGLGMDVMDVKQGRPPRNSVQGTDKEVN